MGKFNEKIVKKIVLRINKRNVEKIVERMVEKVVEKILERIAHKKNVVVTIKEMNARRCREMIHRKTISGINQIMKKDTESIINSLYSYHLVFGRYLICI